jgi:hypothetical protein
MKRLFIVSVIVAIVAFTGGFLTKHYQVKREREHIIKNHEIIWYGQEYFDPITKSWAIKIHDPSTQELQDNWKYIMDKKIKP